MVENQLKVRNNLIVEDGTSSLYAGGAVKDLPEVPAITKLVSRTLDRYSHKMIQYTPDELELSIRQGRTAVVLGPKAGEKSERELLAFTQFWLYDHETEDPFRETFEPGYEYLEKVQAVEVGTWLGPKSLVESSLKVKNKGQAKTVFQAGIGVAAHVYPGLPVVALVEFDNSGAADTIQGMGGTLVGNKISGRLSNGEPRRVTFFGMRNVAKQGGK